jgi:opacity protein-like surface antigen
MRILCCCLVLGLVSLVITSPALAKGDVNFTYGSRTLQDDVWDPIEDQSASSVMLDFGEKDWPVNLAIGYSHSGDDGTLSNSPIFGAINVDGNIDEWSLGAKKVFTLKNPVRPYVGGGLTRVNVDARVESSIGDSKDNDSTTGAYLEGGVYYQFRKGLNLGVHGRLTESTDVTLFDQDTSAEYHELGVLLGYSWPQHK